MPRTTNRVADDEAFGERAAVVGAGGADRVHHGAALDEDHRLAVGVTEERLAFAEIRGADALLQIGTLELVRSVRHVTLLLEGAELIWILRLRRGAVTANLCKRGIVERSGVGMMGESVVFCRGT